MSDSSSAFKNEAPAKLKLCVLGLAASVLILCLMGWLAFGLKQHLHIPARVENGKTSYWSLLGHQNAVDLFTLAQAHDKAGETELANIDYKAGVASPGFQKLPPKIKSTLMELVDCRDSMDPNDYFEELVTHSRIGYWKQEQMPLKIYVPGESRADGFTKFDRGIIEDCFKQWCSIVPDRLSVKYIDDPEQADIAFSQKEHPLDLSFSRFVLAHTIPMAAGPEKWSVFPASKARIEPLRSVPEITSEKDPRAEQRHVVFLHEIGHSLGIIGHSANAGDLMYFSGTIKISERDKATMRKIYAPGSIYERAEKAMRSRALANDKYAMIQLAAELDQNGTASPAELKEVFRLTKRAVELGSSRAKLLLGWMYRDGNGVKRDLKLASKYFHEACAEGNPVSLLSLSNIYEKGDGVPQNPDMAEKYLKMALRMDLTRAPAAYGNFLTYQIADTASQEKAAAFYKKGCGSEQVEALTRLALLYQHGEGVAKDPHEADELIAKARKQVDLLKAKDASEYFARACSWAEMYDSQKAIADYTAAIELKPNCRASYLGRGAAYQTLGDNQAACADMTKALELDPDCVPALLARAYSNLGMGNAALALQDINSLLARTKAPDSERLYGLMVGSLAARLVNDEKDAQFMINEASAESSYKAWPKPIIKFLRHEIDDVEFAKEARGYQRSTEVHFYTAMDQTISGKVKDAISNLQWVKENGDKTFYEYPAAVAQLDRLQKAPAAALSASLKSATQAK